MPPRNPAPLHHLEHAPFSALERQLAKHLEVEWNVTDSWIRYTAALCGLQVREGSAYLDLEAIPETLKHRSAAWPALDTLVATLKSSDVVGENGKPLVLADDRYLYLQKYYSFEQQLALEIRRRCEIGSKKSLLQVITGGPGTGKTTLALSHLNAVLDAWDRAEPIRLAAAAPTGKAAARLSESIAGGVARLETSAARKAQLLEIPCLTLHRLLGSLPHRSSFRHDAENPIPVDALVIDEASMVDLPLMLRLFRALPEQCEVLLLGDKDQLASVEVGSVLRDVLEAADQKNSPLHGNVRILSKTYRFAEDSRIYQACKAARDGNASAFAALLASKATDDLQVSEIAPDARRLPESLIQRAMRHHEGIATATAPEEAIDRLAAFIALSPSRQGPLGTVAFNATVVKRLRQNQGLVSEGATPLHGTPLIVLENSYELQRFNGDLGVVWTADGGSRPKVLFQESDGSVAQVSLDELPRWETAYALTIHKSQGSEFDAVACLFPPQEAKLTSRELIYTGLSRARSQLHIYANTPALAEALATQAQRASRLAALLRG